MTSSRSTSGCRPNRWRRCAPREGRAGRWPGAPREVEPGGGGGGGGGGRGGGGPGGGGGGGGGEGGPPPPPPGSTRCPDLGSALHRARIQPALVP
ncbi:hypothetical protein D7U87_16990 [Stenotrophomonas maltophilia]|nr:hypothetical protein [Stenotrophomonas maltophilia]